MALLAAGLCCVGALARAAEAEQGYPLRPIRVVVPYSPGGSSDTVARIISQKIGEALGQSLVIDNRPGAAGSLGRDIVAKAAPDGYTLLFGDSPHTINVHVLRHVPYDPVKDFAPISLVATTPQVLVVHPGIAAQSVRDLIAMAKAEPGKLNYGSGGSGSITHLTGELFKLAAQINLVHVPYKSIAPAMTDVIGGQIQAAFPSMPGAAPHARAGRLRALAVTSAKRASALPEVPTFDEAGVAGMLVMNWFGAMAPARTPEAIVSRLHAELVKAVRARETQEKFAALALETVSSTPAEFRRMLETELAKWGKVVRQAGIKPE
jgi:tripartite-type tricarboxylate transporter receptor subunit TctC